MANLTTTQAAARLGITRGRVLQLIQRNQLAASKPGRDWMVPEKAVKERLESQPKPGRPGK